ncbi:MAG: hypothetical protein HQ508_07285, partial [Candidatus Marinimicrobia bacterium]|nr:hypothetical protein [Candidatus Neomarinimicrobiota bacterium]
KDNLGHLVNGIDKNYGEVLMDELMRRMEATVSEFNEEVKAMLGQLQGIKTTPRDNIMSASNRSAPPTPRKPAPAESFEAPFVEPIIKTIADPFVEPITEAEGELDPALKDKPIKEVEIEVDLDGDDLSEFEKKLRTLSS